MTPPCLDKTTLNGEEGYRTVDTRAAPVPAIQLNPSPLLSIAEGMKLMEVSTGVHWSCLLWTLLMGNIQALNGFLFLAATRTL